RVYHSALAARTATCPGASTDGCKSPSRRSSRRTAPHVGGYAACAPRTRRGRESRRGRTAGRHHHETCDATQVLVLLQGEARLLCHRLIPATIEDPHNGAEEPCSGRKQDDPAAGREQLVERPKCSDGVGKVVEGARAHDRREAPCTKGRTHPVRQDDVSEIPLRSRNHFNGKIDAHGSGHVCAREPRADADIEHTPAEERRADFRAPFRTEENCVQDVVRRSKPVEEATRAGLAADEGHPSPRGAQGACLFPFPPHDIGPYRYRSWLTLVVGSGSAISGRVERSRLRPFATLRIVTRTTSPSETPAMSASDFRMRMARLFPHRRTRAIICQDVDGNPNLRALSGGLAAYEYVVWLCSRRNCWR